MFVLRGIVYASSIFNFLVTILWIGVAYFLGKAFHKAVSKNKVIGAEEES
jgi:hypothetical protein